MTAVQMIPTRHYRQIGTGDPVFGAGRFLGDRVASFSHEFITWHKVLKKHHYWPPKRAIHLFSFYEEDDG